MAAVTRVRTRQGGRRSPNEVRNILKGLLFISPWLLGFFVFTIYPIVASFYYSFTRYDIISEPHWIGLANYQNLLFDDATFRIVLFNTGAFPPLALDLPSHTVVDQLHVAPLPPPRCHLARNRDPAAMLCAQLRQTI